MNRLIKFINCTEGKSSDFPTELCRKDIDTALQVMLDRDHCRHTNSKCKFNRFGGKEIKDKFYGFVMPLTAENLYAHEETFIHVSLYQDKVKTYFDEFGAIGLLRIFKSTRYMSLYTDNAFDVDSKISKSVNGNDIYSMPIIKNCENKMTEILMLRYTLHPVEVII